MVLFDGTQLDNPLYHFKINDWPTTIMIRNEWKTQQHNCGDLQNKHEVDMHYLAPFHRSKLFDSLQQTITKKKKVDDETFHVFWWCNIPQPKCEKN